MVKVSLLGNPIFGIYLYWLREGHTTLALTAFRLTNSSTELVTFEKIKAKWLGITSIQYLRIHKTDWEIRDYLEQMRKKGVPVWVREVTPAELDRYCARFGSRLSWRREDLKLLFARNDSIVPGDLSTPGAAAI